MTLNTAYVEEIARRLDILTGEQTDVLLTGARMLADTLSRDGFVYTFGTGHSHLLALEPFYRAGGFARVCPILDTGLMLHEGAVKSTFLERVEGYAAALLDRYPMKRGDVLILASNSGRNAVPVEMALAAGERGAAVLAITSLAHARSTPSRHASGKHLHDVADVVIDNLGAAGDACLPVEGVGSVGPTSTVMGCVILHTLFHNAALLLAEEGHGPEVFHSANAGEDGRNDALIGQYRMLIRNL